MLIHFCKILLLLLVLAVGDRSVAPVKDINKAPVKDHIQDYHELQEPIPNNIPWFNPTLHEVSKGGVLHDAVGNVNKAVDLLKDLSSNVADALQVHEDNVNDAKFHMDKSQKLSDDLPDKVMAEVIERDNSRMKWMHNALDGVFPTEEDQLKTEHVKKVVSLPGQEESAKSTSASRASDEEDSDEEYSDEDSSDEGSGKKRKKGGSGELPRAQEGLPFSGSGSVEEESEDEDEYPRDEMGGNLLGGPVWGDAESEEEYSGRRPAWGDTGSEDEPYGKRGTGFAHGGRQSGNFGGGFSGQESGGFDRYSSGGRQSGGFGRQESGNFDQYGMEERLPPQQSGRPLGTFDQYSSAGRQSGGGFGRQESGDFGMSGGFGRQESGDFGSSGGRSSGGRDSAKVHPINFGGMAIGVRPSGHGIRNSKEDFSGRGSGRIGSGTRSGFFDQVSGRPEEFGNGARQSGSGASSGRFEDFSGRGSGQFGSGTSSVEFGRDSGRFEESGRGSGQLGSGARSGRFEDFSGRGSGPFGGGIGSGTFDRSSGRSVESGMGAGRFGSGASSGQFNFGSEDFSGRGSGQFDGGMGSGTFDRSSGRSVESGMGAGRFGSGASSGQFNFGSQDFSGRGSGQFGSGIGSGTFDRSSGRPVESGMGAGRFGSGASSGQFKFGSEDFSGGRDRNSRPRTLDSFGFGVQERRPETAIGRRPETTARRSAQFKMDLAMQKAKAKAQETSGRRTSSEFALFDGGSGSERSDDSVRER